MTGAGASNTRRRRGSGAQKPALASESARVVATL
jgi:hypothetical protein